VRFGSAFWLNQFLLLALKLALSAKVRQVKPPAYCGDAGAVNGIKIEAS
jgi:hypothetical protein